MKTLFVKYLALLSILMAAAVASASPLAVDLKLFSVSADKDGKEQLTEVTEISPGQTVEYRATFTNVSDRDLSGLTPEIPVPAGLVLLLDSPKPKAVTASVDGQTFGKLPLVNEKGEAVPAAQIRSVRWAPQSLKAKESTVVSLRAKVQE